MTTPPPPIVMFPGSRRLAPPVLTVPPSPRHLAVEWYGTPNFWQGRPNGPPVAIVIHTTACRLDVADSWFANPAAMVSAHFAAGLGGELHQYTRLQDRAWANGILEADNRWGLIYPHPLVNPNNVTVSVETEDLGNPNQPVTDDEFDAVILACSVATIMYPSIQVITGHHLISPHSRPNCPGPRWTKNRIFELADRMSLRLVI
jgi:N-acetyl-anhydromuramyl-L-alanine amidase AmpD